jgi:stage II sporulation protein D
MVLTYKGKLVEAYYHASSGGYTENVENIWFNAIPYLVAVESSYEDLENANYGTWHYELTKTQILEKLKEGNYDINSVSDFYISKYTDVGNVLEITIVDNSGKTYTISKETIRIKLNPYVKSQRFNVSRGISLFAKSSTTTKDVTNSISNSYVIDGNNQIKKVTVGINNINIQSTNGICKAPVTNPDIFIIDGKGYGNNVGMSQEGAKGMAKAGFTFDEILYPLLQRNTIEILN